MLLSVIIPVYNQEQWLESCLDSLRVQAIPDAEFLVVNDGSTDSSAEIIHSYSRKDSRFRLISRENGGYGAAVNTGLDAAIGEWIGIVESDDECFPDMYERLLGATNESGADVVKGGFVDIDEDGEVTGRGNPLFHPGSGNEPFQAHNESELYVIHHSLWSAIYRREFLIAHRIRCPENRGGYQDAGFAFSLWMNNPLVLWLSEPVYRYRRFRTGNTMGSGGKAGAAAEVLRYIADDIVETSRDTSSAVSGTALGAAVRGLMATGVWHLLRLGSRHRPRYATGFADILSDLENRCPAAWEEAMKLIRGDRLRYPLVRAIMRRRCIALNLQVFSIRMLSKMLAEDGIVRGIVRRLRHDR